MQFSISSITKSFVVVLALIVVSACGSSSPAPAISANTFLENVILSDGTLSQPFERNVDTYNATVTFDVTSITLTPKVEDPSAKVSVNGQDVIAGRASQDIALNVGDNRISVVVTAQDGSTHRTYTFIVTRSASANAELASLTLSSGGLGGFLPTVHDYSLNVASHVDGVSVTAVPAGDVSSLTVNGVNVIPGQASGKINLDVGVPKVISIVVVAQDDITSETYTLVVTRNAAGNSASNVDLSSLSVLGGTLSPSFSAAQPTYNVTVANTVTSTKITPTAADLSSSISVDGALVYSGDQSGDIPLAVGNNSISVLVTSILGDTKEYTVNVYREPRTNADLSSIGLSVGTLSPVFSADVISYTASVYYSENNISVSPFVADTAASVTVKGVSLPQGQTSINVGLVTGNNSIPIVVTAQDGTTQKTYTLTVVRQPGDNASLSSLVLSNGTLLPAFSADTYSYSVEVVNAVNSITVTPTADIPYTDIRVNGTQVSSGQTSNAINLAEGPNVVTVSTTSENGKVAINYSLNIHRQRLSPVFSGVSSFSLDENGTLAGTVTATQEGGEIVTYSVSGGNDQALFSINSSSGDLSFISAPDYETPVDSDANNIYQVEVTATSIINAVNYSTPKTISVFINDVDEVPVFTSTATPNMLENLTAAQTVVAADPEGSTVTYSLTGGDDMALFAIDSASGALTFNSAPDYEAPGDFDADNVYVVEVTATSGVSGSELTTAQMINVTVDNEDEAPVFSNAASASIDENTTAVMTVTATDPEAADIASYSVSGGADASFFTIDSVSGALSFQVSPDFEAPGDAGPDNVYDVEVTASFTINSLPVNVMQTISVTVLNVDEAPVIGSSNTASMPENNTAAHTVSAIDPEGAILGYAITGGADQALFSIGATTGALDFVSAPSYEVPEDANADNVYEVEVTVGDGLLSTVQTISISVTDVFDLDVLSNNINQLNFLWTDIAGASYYKLNVNPDGASGYTQVGTDIVGTGLDLDISVHLTDWQNALYRLEAYDAGNTLINTVDNVPILPVMLDSIGYFKPHNPTREDYFGSGVQISDDGKTIVLGSTGEDSMGTGVNTSVDGDDHNTPSWGRARGAVYVFSNNSGTWVEEAYIKPSINGNSLTLNSANFGAALGLSGDGNTLAASWYGDGIGKVFIFTRSGSTWTEQGYLSVPNADAGDQAYPTLSGDGLTLAIHASGDDSNATGIGLGGSTDNSLTDSGAVYIFKYNGTSWVEEAFIKPEAGMAATSGNFGSGISMSTDGNTLVIGDTYNELVHKYSRSGSTWTYDYSLTGNNTETTDTYTTDGVDGDQFGSSTALSSDGTILAVGAPYEDGSANTIDGADDNNCRNCGAAYMFSLGVSSATQTAYIKSSSFIYRESHFGGVDLSSNGSMLAVGATGESGTGTGVNNNTGLGANGSGAAFIFENNSGWAQRAYVKAPMPDYYDGFGILALSADGSRLAVSARYDDSAASGIGGSPENSTIYNANFGGLYLY